MVWEAAGAIGEIGGALAVVATLFYLSRQFRQNLSAMESAREHAWTSAMHETNSVYVEVFSLLALDAELASIYRRALDGEPLDAVEAVRFAAFVNAFFAFMEQAYTQSGSELVRDHAPVAGEATIALFHPYWGRLLATEAGMRWWVEDAPGQYLPEFVAAVNAVMANRTAEAHHTD